MLNLSAKGDGPPHRKSKIFARLFAMGVVSGIVMAFQFGTNWSALSERTGSIQGRLLGYAF
jgi:cytochrome d ubiquinol oxidase subunit I